MNYRYIIHVVIETRCADVADFFCVQDDMYIAGSFAVDGTFFLIWNLRNTLRKISVNSKCECTKFVRMASTKRFLSSTIHTYIPFTE